jgi:hypothetical protein
VAEVIGPRRTVNKDVVKKDKHEPSEEGPENVVHQRLERGRRVAETERHDEELIEPIMGPERRLVDVGGQHAYLVISGAQVELGEEAGAMQLVQQLVDHGDREGVLDGEGVQGPVVDAETPAAIRLPDEQHRGREGGVAAPNNALLQHGRALLLQFVLVGSRVPVGSDRYWLCAGLEVDGMIAGALGGHAVGFGEDVDELRQ